MAKYYLLQIDAWSDGDGYYWNNSFFIDEIKTRAQNIKRVFLKELKKRGVVCKRGKMRVVDVYYTGVLYELQYRKDGEPVYALQYVEV